MIEVALLLPLGLAALGVKASDDLIVDFVIRLYVVMLVGTYAQFAIVLLAEVVKCILVNKIRLAEILRLQPVRE